ncbi:hypothetical protein AYJ54_29395 [Bradyrhizobium centrolobii]|uniref:Uncharacterized protein n=1 Tax=Bradyrhizobium centrolobii TaxID=1505087 RepID=A0A176YA32_9BRAD|nr:hypothetical protein AYJ54_29395 [Bradyrhizobium centrolobii]
MRGRTVQLFSVVPAKAAESIDRGGRGTELRVFAKLFPVVMGPGLRRDDVGESAVHSDPRHCERSEAIQSLSAGGSLDCFAALAMTE